MRYIGAVKNNNDFSISSLLPYAIGYKTTIIIKTKEERLYPITEEGFKKLILDGAITETRKGHDNENIIIAVINR